MSDTAPSTTSTTTTTSTDTSAATAGNTATEMPQAERTITAKVDGQVVTETRQQKIERLSKLSDEELASWDSLAAASQKRFDASARNLREAKEAAARMEDFQKALDGDDPREVEKAFQKLGKDARKVAIRLAKHYYEMDKAPPEQRRKMELDEREREIRQREAAEEAKNQQARIAAEVDNLYQQLSEEVEEIFQGMGMEMDEEVQAELVPRVAFYIDAYRKNNGGHLPTTHEVVNVIRKLDGMRNEKAIKPFVAALEAGDLSKLTPKAKEAMRKAMIAEFSTETPSEGKKPAPPKTNGADAWKPKIYKAGEPDSFKKTLD